MSDPQPPSHTTATPGRTVDAPTPGGAGRHSSRSAVVAALLSNLAVAATKLVGFLVTGSSALLAETLHSLADTGNQALLLLGSYRATVPPSPSHPFGRGRERYFWAFIVGLVLFGLGGVFSLSEGVRKLLSGDHVVTSPIVGIVLILAAMVFEGTSLRTAVREGRRIRPPGQGWWRFIRRTRNPEIAVVLLEDGAAIVGLVVALTGLIASWVTGYAEWDAAATVVIGALLCGVASILTSEMKSLLVGETITPRREAATVEAVTAVDGVDRVLNLRTEHLGPEQVLVCVKIAMSRPANLDRVIDVIDEVERVVQMVIPETLTCYVEPDRFDRDRLDHEWT